MIFVLDTDIRSLLGHQDSPEAPRIRRHIAELPPQDLVVTTIINYEEQMRGWMAALSRAKSRKSEVAIYTRLIQHLRTFQRINVLSYDDRAAAIASALRTQHRSMGAMDLKIASIVRAHNATLVTRNIADFRKVSDLRMEDWTAE